MEPKAVTSNIYELETIYDSTAEQGVECDIVLPDYCPDIQRILRCCVSAMINPASGSGSRVSADGTAYVKVIYVGEDGAAVAYEQSVPFSKTFEVPETEGAMVSVSAATDYANCRAVSPRRIDVRAMLTVSCRSTARRARSIVSGIEGDGIRLRSKSVNAVSAVCCRETTFPMSETVESDRADAPITQVISCSASAVATDVRIITDKLLLKGELLVNICYMTEQAGGARTLHHSMPISRIIEAEGITENCTALPELSVSSIRAEVKNDGSGQARLFDIDARVNAAVSAYASADIPVVADAYSTAGALAVQRQNMHFNTLLDSFSDSFTASAQVDIQPPCVQTLLWSDTGDINYDSVVTNGELIVKGTVMLNLYYIDKDLQTGFAEKPVDFEYRRRLRSTASSAFSEPKVTVTGSEARMRSECVADARIEFAISAIVFGNDDEVIITGVTPAESDAVPAAALTLCFPEAGEELWSIAKRYGTTVDAIMRENGLAGETVEEKRMLLVPRCKGV